MGTNPSSISSSSSIPKFDIVQAGNTSGNQQTYYIRTSGMYLYLNSVSGGSNDLTVQSTGSPNNDMRWIIKLASGYSYNSCNPKFEILPTATATTTFREGLRTQRSHG